MAGILTIALTFWIGIHALRGYLTTVVWNLGGDRPPLVLGAVALGIWMLALLAFPVARRFGGPRPAARLGMWCALAYAAHLAVKHQVAGAVLGIAVVALWLWVVAILTAHLANRHAVPLLVPAMLLGLVAQVSGQAALQGLDLTMLRGPLPAAAGLALGTAWVVGLRRLTTPPSLPARVDQQLRTRPPSGIGLLALGPYLCLQMVLLVNLGRVEMLADLSLPSAAAWVLGGAVVALACVRVSARRSVAVGAALGAVGATAVLAVAVGDASGRPALALLLLAQVLLAAALPAVLASTNGASHRHLHGGLAVSAVLFFALVFLYYSRQGWPILWGVMAALVVAPLMARASARPGIGGVRAAIPAALVAAVAVALSAAGQYAAPPTAGPAPAEMEILTYNVRQGFAVTGIPDPQAQARVIEESGADLIGLQEIGRGWDVNGGPDLVPWLRWRFPRYHLVYGPMNGALWGQVILSRWPVRSSGWARFPVRASTFRRGFTWVTVETPGGELLFVSAHLSAYAGFDADRVGQVEDLRGFWGGRPRTVVVGDFNAKPQETPIRRMVEAGLIDVPAARGLGAALTFPSNGPTHRIDYIFSSRDVEPLDASVGQAQASDHLPVRARIRVR